MYKLSEVTGKGEGELHPNFAEKRGLVSPLDTCLIKLRACELNLKKKHQHLKWKILFSSYSSLGFLARTTM